MIRFVISKINELVELDETQLPATSLAYGLQYGFGQSTNDSHAGVSRKNFPAGAEGDVKYTAAVKAKAYARLKQIREGTIFAAGVTAPVMTPEAIAAWAKANPEAWAAMLAQSAPVPVVEAPKKKVA